MGDEGSQFTPFWTEYIIQPYASQPAKITLSLNFQKHIILNNYVTQRTRLLLNSKCIKQEAKFYNLKHAYT